MHFVKYIQSWDRMVATKLIFVLIAVVAVDAKTNECMSEKLDGCVCSKDYVDRGSMFTVSCVDQNFVNTEMLKELPRETQRLIFTGNKIPVLENNVFGDTDLSSLEIIDMSNNQIREIKGQAFHHVPKVELLILDHNNISISNQKKEKFHHARMLSNFYNLQELHLTNAFADYTDEALASDLHDIFISSNLTKLYKLHLEQNEIRFFKDVNEFCDLPELHDLHLGQNNIPSLNFNISCIKKLRYLDLEQNNITKFYEQELDILDRFAYPYRKENLTLEIEDNPFKCETAAKTLYPWLQKTNVIVKNKDKLHCYQVKYGKKYLVNLRKFAEAKHARFSQALVVLLVILVLILISLLGAYIYLKKESVRKRLYPFYENVTRKVRYTSIESQDV